MGTRSLRLSFEVATPLLGTGIDAEQIARFQRVAATPAGWDIAFAPAEIDHALRQAEPARALCASFCCKEALFKCLRQPFNYPDCVLYYHPGQRDYELQLSGRLGQEFRQARAHAAVWTEDEGREVVAVVLLASSRGAGPQTPAAPFTRGWGSGGSPDLPPGDSSGELPLPQNQAAPFTRGRGSGGSPDLPPGDSSGELPLLQNETALVHP